MPPNVPHTKKLPLKVLAVVSLLLELLHFLHIVLEPRLHLLKMFRRLLLILQFRVLLFFDMLLQPPYPVRYPSQSHYRKTYYQENIHSKTPSIYAPARLKIQNPTSN